MHGLSSVLLLLAAAVVVVMVFRLWRLPPLLGYLTAGILVGPGALALSEGSQSLSVLAEFGVVFLMFSIGLEFSLPKLSAMRRAVFAVGAAQVCLTVSAVVAAVLLLNAVFGKDLPALLLGLDWRAGVVLGGALAMSSTAIVVKALADQMQLDTPHGRSMLGVLLFQDLAVVLFLVLIPALAKPPEALLTALALAALKAFVVLTLLLYAGQRWMQKLFDFVARQQSRELFTLSVLLVTLGLAWLTEWTGLSLALGAFVAGMLIAETPYRHAVEEDIKPFRDVLLGLFFLTLGLQLNLDVLARHPWAVLACFVLPVAVKAALVYAAIRHAAIGAQSAATSVRSALGLCTAGEFGFVMLNLAMEKTLSLPLLPAELSQVVLAAMLLSMLAAPLLIAASDRAANQLAAKDWLGQSLQLHQLASAQVQAASEVIILGYGRSGQAVAQILTAQGRSTLALDLDPDRVAEAKAAGFKVQYGDALRRETLRTLQLHRAKAAIVTFAHTASQLKVLADVRALAPDLPIIVRSHDETALPQLKAAGATDVVPELVEGSLMLASHALLRLGVPMRRVWAATQAARGDGYQGLGAYFHGADDSALAGARLHTVVLPSGAWAVGRSVAEAKIKLARIAVNVLAVRDALGEGLQDGERCSADTAWLLRGEVAALGAAETALLK